MSQVKKRLYKDGAGVYIKNLDEFGTVKSYRKGNKYPYVVELQDGNKVYRSFKGLMHGKVDTKTVTQTIEKVVYRDRVVYQSHPQLKSKAYEPKKGHIMSTVTNLRAKVRAAMRSSDESLLIRTGFIYDSGALTKEGRKVVADLQFNGMDNKDIRAEVVNLAKALEGEEVKKSKSSK